MDLWVVGAAAAAGYIAKHWQNFSRDTEASNSEKPELSRRKKQTKDMSTNVGGVSEGRFSELCQLNSLSEVAVSTSGCGENMGIYDDLNVLSLSSLPPGLSTNENLKENVGGCRLSGDMGEDCAKPGATEMDSSHNSRRNKSSLRTKRLHGQFLKPLSSLESCLMAQLHQEHARMEEYVLSVLPSPSATTRPLLLTDGSQIINRSTSNAFSGLNANGDNGPLKEENAFGVPLLPEIETMNLPMKIKSKTGKGCNERYNSSFRIGCGKHFHSNNGLHSGLTLFCFGISIGIISSLVANRREVEKVKELLKQTDNLVQDLQEELEMKDSLTVKELANETSQDTCENSVHSTAQNPLFPFHNVTKSTNNDGVESYKVKEEEGSESMSKIEAELEVELERLGLNMNTSNLEGRLSDLLELDPDFVADFAQGELQPDVVNGRHFDQPESNKDASCTTTPHSGNYAVSPQELSLRLHEVIQSRLEERVRELETALQNSQRKVQLMELEHKNGWGKLSGRELRYSSGEESPIAKGDCNDMARPLIMNLAGEALDAYNEAIEELTNENELEEDGSPTRVYESNYHMQLHSDQSGLWDHNGGANGSLQHFTQTAEKISKELYNNWSKPSAKHDSGNQKLLCGGVSEDENGDCNDAMEKQLIKQLVEKTRKGSPAVLNAQRVLFSMDENER